MRIAVDAMGGDYAPSVVIEGVRDALNDFSDIEVVLVGHREKLAFYLEKYNLESHSRLHLVHAETVVEMGELSVTSLRGKKDSSITVMANVLKSGDAVAGVSAGHTGAAVAATKVRVRMLEGIDRPAIVAMMPAAKGYWSIVDAGANTECKPHNLAHFAIMGEAYSHFTFNIEEPRIGLLSVGGEDAKGNDLTKEAFKLLSKMPINFIGNIEGHDLFSNVVDVVVCDGFVGNVVVKSSESMAMATVEWLKKVFTKNALRKTSALLAKNAFKDLKAIGDFEEYGGAPLLGLKNICIIGHGTSTAKAIKNAIRLARDFVKLKVNDRILEKLRESKVLSGQ